MLTLITVFSVILPWIMAQGTNSAPRFSQPVYEFSCEENTEIDAVIFTLNATDADSGPNGDLVFTMVTNPWFKISNTGSIKVKSVIDAEDPTVSEIQTYSVTVSDQGSPPLTDTAVVSIFINDTNEDRPRFIEPLYFARMTDGDPPGKSLVVASASDRDRDAVLFYKFLVPELLLEMNNETGEIYTKDKVLLEDTLAAKGSARYHVQIRVDDGLYIDISRLMVSVIDRNHYPPDFNPVMYNTSIAENVDGVELLSVQATDTREQPHQKVHYSLLNQTNPGTLSINSKTGAITLVKALDREALAGDEIIQYILAMDDGYPAPVLTSTATLTLTIIDANDNPPQFSMMSYNLILSQTYQSGKQVFLPTATDLDIGDNAVIEYVLTPGIDGQFSVNRDSNMLTTLTDCGPDCVRTVNCFYKKIQVLAFNPGMPSQNDTVDINIVLTRPGFSGNAISNITGLLDCSKAPHPNDNPPSFSRNLYDVTVYENVTIDTVVLTLSASDPDRGLSGTVTYTLDSPYFAINDSGHIVTAKELDYEALVEKKICFQVNATDRGIPPKTGTTRVCVNVMNVNESPPRFDSRVYNISVKHGDRQGTSFLTVSATDNDTDTILRYEIQNPNKYFQIDPKTGQVSLAKTVNITDLLEGAVNDRISLTVRVTDGEFYSDTTLMIHLERRNDHAPSFTSNRYNVTVKEQLSPVTLVTVSANDPDVPKQTLTFDIITTPTQGTFFIHPTTGKITLNSKLDRETLPAGYIDLVVIVTDSGLPPPVRTGTTTVRVWVSDVNEYLPRFPAEQYDLRMYQNYTTNATFQLPRATDADAAATLRYSLSENARHVFDIDELTGKVRTKQGCNEFCLVLEDCLYMTFTVMVYNPDKPDMNDSMTVNMTLLTLFPSANQSDLVSCDSAAKPNKAPHFAQDTYQASFFESVVPGTSVLVVSASDSDPGPYGQVEYFMRGTKDFNITQTGHIYTMRNMDYEHPTDRKSCMTVVAIDMGFPRLESTANVCLILKDINDNKPRFSKDMYFTTVTDGTPEGEVLIDILATDADQHPSITYSFKSQNKYFKLAGRNVTVSTQIDRADILKTFPHSLVELTLIASDGSNEDRVALYIAVMPTESTCPSVAGSSDTIIGLLIAALILVLIIACIAICCYRRRKKKQQRPSRRDSSFSSFYSNKTKSDLIPAQDKSLYMSATLTLPRGCHSDEMMNRYYEPFPAGKSI